MHAAWVHGVYGARAHQVADSLTLCQQGAYVCRVNASMLPGVVGASKQPGAAAPPPVSLQEIFGLEMGHNWDSVGSAVLDLHSLRPALVLRQVRFCLLLCLLQLPVSKGARQRALTVRYFWHMWGDQDLNQVLARGCWMALTPVQGEASLRALAHFSVLASPFASSCFIRQGARVMD